MNRTGITRDLINFANLIGRLQKPVPGQYHINMFAHHRGRGGSAAIGGILIQP